MPPPELDEEHREEMLPPAKAVATTLLIEPTDLIKKDQQMTRQNDSEFGAIVKQERDYWLQRAAAVEAAQILDDWQRRVGTIPDVSRNRMRRAVELLEEAWGWTLLRRPNAPGVDQLRDALGITPEQDVAADAARRRRDLGVRP